MEILRLKAINFRNFENLELNFQPEGALIFGKNGLGKTNLLEAISFFAFGKSFRTGRDQELINFSKAFFRLEAEFNYSGNTHFLEAAADKSKKILKIDKMVIGKIGDLYRHLKIVYFSPQDIEIIGGSPSFRRNFFNQAIAQFSFNHILDSRKFFRILKQRNALLKNKFDREEKKIWDEQFIEASVSIIEQRLNYLHKFVPELTELYNVIAGGRERLDVRYKYSFPISQTNDLKSDFRDYLREIEEQEIVTQRTLIGPHLDDFEFLINGKDTRKFASQGQKRSLAICVRLAQARLISKSANEFPIIMFDDVLAELDKIRAGLIVKLLHERHQIFIATPNAKIYENFHLPLLNLEKVIG